MSCASCAARIEKKLNTLDAVEATVNFATEQATVHCGADVPVEQLVAAVESVGYGARQPGLHTMGVITTSRSPSSHGGWTLAIVLTVPVALVAMLPPLQFAGWEWLALALSTPVVFYSGIGFHRAALRSARHAAATMDTLISLGTLQPGSGRPSCSSAACTRTPTSRSARS